MILFPDGIAITTIEQDCLSHIIPDADGWMGGLLAEKAARRREALIQEWRPRLFADASVTELPADSNALAEFIMARDDYQTRREQDASRVPPEPLHNHATATFAGTSRVGLMVTLFASGITVADTDANCIRAYAQDLDDWIIGALMGQINRGKKKMIAKYQPIIMADPSVTTMPATEDELLAMIVARADYQRLGG